MIIGKRISGRYKILDMIGGGGMANVYLAHDMILDRDVAVKMLRLDYVNNDEFIRRFHREAQSATSLVHPNIVNIYDVDEEDDLYFIVMEYVKGQTLKQYIQHNSPLRVEETLDIMKQLTSAISHAHQNDIVHRDIKPHNILIDREGNVKVTDFGIAMALSATSITQTNSVLGSVHYLSPEQARGGMANKKSDIYSLGIVMFELLTGRLPFSGESAVSIALKHLQSETPSVKRWNEDVPQSVENIVLKATAKDPFHRYNSVEEMEEDLRTALYPQRVNEQKFVIPKDEEVTKAIPVITNDRPFQRLDETIVHGNNKQNQKTDPVDATNGKEKKKRKKWPAILVSLFAALVILGIFAVTVLPEMLSPRDVQIPDVKSMDLNEAISKLQSAGFVIGDTNEISDEKIEEGLIVKTYPKAGKTVKEGSEIDLYQSTGKEKFELSDYRSRQYDDVVRLLEDKNFKDIVKTEVFDDSDAGTIIEQSYSQGDEVVPEDTVLEFTVSKGPALVTLKNLTDYNEKGIKEYADSVGIKYVISGKDYHDTIGEGLVISQNPAPGTSMKKGDTVSVVLSMGKKEIPPKKVVKEVEIPYEPVQEGIPQEVQIYIEDLNRSMTEPVETFYIKENTKKQLELMIPYDKDKKAGYKIIRDNSVIIDEVIPYPEEP